MWSSGGRPVASAWRHPSPRDDEEITPRNARKTRKKEETEEKQNSVGKCRGGGWTPTRYSRFCSVLSRLFFVPCFSVCSVVASSGSDDVARAAVGDVAQQRDDEQDQEDDEH